MPLLKIVLLNDKLPLQSVPGHTTHLALSVLSIEKLPMLPLFPNPIELHFSLYHAPDSVTPIPITIHPTIRCLYIRGIRMLPFLALPALEHLHYQDICESSSIVSAFLSKSHCTLKTLTIDMLLALEGDDHNAIYKKLISPDFLPNLEHLIMTSFDKEFCVRAVKIIWARWSAPVRRIRTFVFNTMIMSVHMVVMQAMIDEGLDFKVVDGRCGTYGKEAWLDPLMTEIEDVYSEEESGVRRVLAHAETTGTIYLHYILVLSKKFSTVLTFDRRQSDVRVLDEKETMALS
ncbi:hypothetical protein ARMGADRAFT_1105214 [Armillaria gallica]|uniref:Uncharacterized protein n=1 Tax=Armillaria gallica TaxID=47427 RepID=A0A2H3DCB3_ARMGA|nr:hypothetical protein ARMGADRAFT_1105214 [Armillaria gallica]